MRIRFTDFLKIEKQEIALYVKQEVDPYNFTIQLSNSDSKEIIFMKKTEDNWFILNPSVPTWIKALKPLIVTAIEYHWFVEFFMKSDTKERKR